MNSRSGNSIGILVPSADSIRNSVNMSTQTPEQIVDDYLSLPKLPYGQTITVDKIVCLNYNPMSKSSSTLLKYRLFRERCPEDFPPCQDPQMDYTDDDDVSPVMFISGSTKYRVKQLLWFPLCDAFSQILARQGKLNRKLLPIQLLIDEKDQFMVKIMNLGLV